MKPRLLDLFSGAGGAGMGYHRAGFEVTGIDIAPQKNYPFDFVQADALEYVAAHGHEYDVIHASPPCQFGSVLTPIEHKHKHPNLIPATRAALIASGKLYVIENVAGSRKHLINPVMLCGSMFGLRIWRHRFFECNPPITYSPFSCQHNFVPVLISGSTTRGGTKKTEFSVATCREASGIDWMTRAELDESIPPAFTEWIGRQILVHIQTQVSEVLTR